MHFVEGFRKVEKNCVYLARLVEAVVKVTLGVDELSFAATEAVLEVRKMVIAVKEVVYGAIDNVFQEFEDETSKGDRPLVAYKGLT